MSVQYKLLMLIKETEFYTQLCVCMCAGPNGTLVSVVQYGDPTTAEFTWAYQQSKSDLPRLVESIPTRTPAAPALGKGILKLMCTYI